MHRSNYDTDVSVWSPQGRLFQVEYAMEAVKQGSCTVGLKSDKFAVLTVLKKAPSELSGSHQKLFKIDDHMGIAISGISADGRILTRYMRNECLNHRFVFESELPVGRLVRRVADKSQECTQRSWKRPYGVGLLAIGYDKAGSHLYQTCPSGNYYDWKAMAIGVRSQGSKTYLEHNYEKFGECNADQLIKHGLMALWYTLQNEDLTADGCAAAIVGEDLSFTILEDEQLKPYVDEVLALGLNRDGIEGVPQQGGQEQQQQMEID
eukprot:TRINITY_DN1022_c0_g1_i1.p1 TRINITY_DN1022_c0_g1~~TRINITY_DN1022_c0_g1_i1.p1  ORF type:complete len:264 (+),score=48.67 TRINITY_DN1022_c0_g1_i1:145-936(+)